MDVFFAVFNIIDVIRSVIVGMEKTAPITATVSFSIVSTTLSGSWS